MRAIYKVLAAVSALALSPSANAATTIITPSIQPVGTFFVVGGNIFSGPITASFGHAGIVAGAFTDLFQFTIPQTGMGSGSVTTGTTTFQGTTDLDFTSVLVNGLAATPTYRDVNNNVCTTPGVGTCGSNETFAILSVPITFGVLNTISVSGTSRGNGSFGGNATFIPSAVPEPATWAMMLFGFGATGVALRRRRASTPQAA